jgi:hypothetical protein
MIQRIAETMQLSKRLNEQRWRVAVSEPDVPLETRQHCATPHTNLAPHHTTVHSHLQYGTDQRFPGTYFLTGLSAQWRRTNERVPIEDATPSQAPALATSRACDSALTCRRRQSHAITGTAAGMPGSPQVFSSDN